MLNNGQFNLPQQPSYINPMFYGANRTPTMPIQTNNRIIWVNGIEGAKAYQIEPNSNILLLDSDTEGIMYIKTCDNIGMCSLRTFTYTELTETAPTTQIDTTQFVTKDEMQNAINQAMATLQPKEAEKQKKGVMKND